MKKNLDEIETWSESEFTVSVFQEAHIEFIGKYDVVLVK